MGFFKKEWKTLLLIVCLAAMTVYLGMLKAQINQIQIQNSKIAATLDSVESIALTIDAQSNQVSKKIDEIGGNVAFIVEKVRRR